MLFILGDITIMGDVITFDSDQLTLTCISAGGPVTTVTWTRHSITVTEGTKTVLDDPETALYTHTLTVTPGGEYTCTVDNNKPSSGSAIIILGGLQAFSVYGKMIVNYFIDTSDASPPSDVEAVQHGFTSIIVTLTASRDATGYRISYTSDSDGGNVVVDGGHTNSHTLMGSLMEICTISIVNRASSSHGPPRPPVEAGIVALCGNS